MRAPQGVILETQLDFAYAQRRHCRDGLIRFHPHTV